MATIAPVGLVGQGATSGCRSPVPARGRKSFDSGLKKCPRCVHGDAAFFATKAHEEKCGDPINFSGPSGTSLLIVPGEYEKLFHLVRENDFLDLYTKALFAAPDIRYEIGVFGEGVQEMMARWSKVGAELALI